jgi:hypothetical protein
MFFDPRPTVCLPSDSLSFASLPYKSGSIGSTLPASRQEPRALEDHFVVFCQLVGLDVRALWLDGKHQRRKTLRLLSI